MRISIKHLYNKYKWIILRKKREFISCCSNFRNDIVLLSIIKQVKIINSWIDIRKGKICNRNLGDDLNYYILKETTSFPFRFKSCTFLSKIIKDNYLCIGSIISHGNKNSIVWGAGCISQNSHIPALKKVYVVRGPKTRELLMQAGISCPENYGDPVLLLPLIYNPHTTSSNKIGVILNAADEQSEILDIIKNNDSYTFISMAHYSDWREVVLKITQCRLVLSSSLHGLIISDAYNIPNIWVSIDNCKNIIGGNFKYLDYFESVKRHQKEPVELSEILHNDINDYMDMTEKPQIDLKPIIENCPFKINFTAQNS